MRFENLRWKLTAAALPLVMLVTLVPSLHAEDQPHMKAALQALQRARQELQAAAHDKGGHRAKALQLTDNAIQQTQQGVRYANQHGKHNDRDRDHDHR